MGQREEPAFDFLGELAISHDHGGPLECNEVDQIEETAGQQKYEPKLDVLRVVAGCGSNGGVGEGPFLFLLDCHVVGVEAGQDEGGEEHPEDVVDVDSSKQRIFCCFY